MLLRPGGRQRPAALEPTVHGVVTQCSPLCVTIGDRVYGPLATSSGVAGVMKGDKVLLARHETDADLLTVVSIVGRTPAATGGGSSQQLTFSFSTPAATWTVSHGLGKRPLVQTLDSSGVQFDADVAYPDLNTVVVTHAQPLVGSVLVLT